jgi:hypothetical protein
MNSKGGTVLAKVVKLLDVSVGGGLFGTPLRYGLVVDSVIPHLLPNSFHSKSKQDVGMRHLDK